MGIEGYQCAAFQSKCANGPPQIWHNSQMADRAAPLNQQVQRVTERIQERSSASRARYLEQTRAAAVKATARGRLSCTSPALMGSRPPRRAAAGLSGNEFGMGRDLFANFRTMAGNAESGAISFR
jgi:hypothetical protein